MGDNRSLTCRVCHNYLKGPIRQCAKDNSHNFCKICIDKFDECVVCGGTVPFRIDVSIEKALLTQNYPCKFSENGCELTLPLQLKAEHENECIYKIHKCEYIKFTRSGNCPWKGKYNEINTHFRSHIKSSFGNMPISVPMKLVNAKSFNYIQLVRQHNEIFWYKHRIDFPKQKVFFMFQLVGTKQMASEFYYKIEIISKQDPNLKHESTKYCISDSEDAMDAFNNENCCVVSFKQASEFIMDDTISFNFYIKKKELKIENLKIGEESKSTSNSPNTESAHNANRKQYQQRRQPKTQNRKNFKNDPNRDASANRKRSNSKPRGQSKGTPNYFRQASAPQQSRPTSVSPQKEQSYCDSSLGTWEFVNSNHPSSGDVNSYPVQSKKEFTTSSYEEQERLRTGSMTMPNEQPFGLDFPLVSNTNSYPYQQQQQTPRREPPPPYEPPEQRKPISACETKEMLRTYKDLLNEASSVSSNYSNVHSFQQPPSNSPGQYRSNVHSAQQPHSNSLGQHKKSSAQYRSQSKEKDCVIS